MLTELTIKSKYYYDRPLIISYPRSGVNYLLHMIQLFKGTTFKDYENDLDGFYIHRSHDVRGTGVDSRPTIRTLRNSDDTYRYKKIVLILRDYYDCYLRSEKRLRYKTTDLPLRRLTHTALESYFVNLQAYDDFPEAKFNLYYESEIQSNNPCYLRDLFYFLGIDYSNWPHPNQIANAIVHIKKVYEQKQRHKYKVLPYNRDEKVRLTTYIKKKYPRLFDTYLHHYEVL